MKKHLLKLLTGLTAISLTVAQPVSVLASETDYNYEQSAQENQGSGESGDQPSNENNDNSSSDDATDNEETDSAETTKQTEEAAAEENKETDPSQQTEMTDAEQTETGTENEQTEGVAESEQTEGAENGELTDNSEQEGELEEGTETTEEEGEASGQSLEQPEKSVADDGEEAAKKADTNTAANGETRSSESKTSETTKSDESAAEKKEESDTTEKKTAEEQTEDAAAEKKAAKTNENGLDLGDAVAEDSDIAVLNEEQSQIMLLSLDEGDVTRNVNDTVATVTTKDGIRSYNSLQDAIDAVDEDDTTISLVKDVDANVVISGKNIKNFVLDLCGKTITSVENAAQACIDIISSTVTVKNTNAEKNEDGTIKKASVTGSTASGIKISKSTVDLIGLLVKGNTSTTLGGGVQATDSTLNVQDTEFVENHVSGANTCGGAIAATNGKLNIGGSTFTKNTAVEGNGGAVYTREVDSVDIRNSTFEANTALNGGAYASITASAPYKTVTKVNIENVEILNNKASNLGGGLFFNGYDHSYGYGEEKCNNVTVTDSTISGNTAGQQGGGILAYGAKLTIDSTENEDGTVNGTAIKGNKATLGGGVFSFHSDVELKKGTVVSGNTASSYGGGLYTSYDTSFKMSGVTVDGNKATVNYGGGVFAYGTTVNVTDSSKIKNNQGRLGGGLAAYAAIVNVSDSSITENKGITYTDANGKVWAASGAGILICSKGTVNLKNTAVTGNGDKNTSEGGAVVVYSGSELTTDAKTTIMDNSADMGGGLYIYGKATISNGTKLYNNTAETAGADVYLAPGAEITLTPVGEKWVLNDDSKHVIDGWYIDAKNARWSGTSATGLKGYLAEGVTITLNADGSYTIKVAADARDGFALRAGYASAETPSNPSTPAGTAGTATATTAPATATPAVLGASRTPEVVETAAEEPEVLGAEREPAVLGATRGHGTGDESHMGVWGVVSLASLAALVGVGAFMARKKKRD